MKKRLNKKGFTLIELIVVIAILAILAAILIPSLSGYIQKATDSKNQANCRALYTQYALDVAVSTTGTATAPALAGGATAITAVSSGGVVTSFSCTFGTNGTFTAPNFVKS